MDESAILGCHPWMEKCHPWMKTTDDGHGQSNNKMKFQSEIEGNYAVFQRAETTR